MAMTAEKDVRVVSLVLSALSTGGFFGTRVGLGPSTKDFTPATYVEVQQATIRNLRPVMGTLLPSAVMANAAVLALSRRRDRPATFALTGAGLAAQLTSLILTGVIELPINATVMTWTPADPPEDWQSLRDRWASVHTVRTVASVVGFGCLAAAAVRR